MKVIRLSYLTLAAVFTPTYISAVVPAIGVASAMGHFTLNSSEVEGNANLFNGSAIRTTQASSKLYLSTGAALVLGLNSSGTVYSDRFDLREGAAKADNFSGYSIEAYKYSVRPGMPSSKAVVRVEPDSVEISALAGSLDIFNRRGELLTRIAAGTATSFQRGSSTGASGASTSSSSAEIRKVAAIYIAAGVALAALGLAADAILQPTSTSP